MVAKIQAVLVSLVLAVLIGSPAGAQTLKERVGKRFDVLPIADGIVLTPKFKTDVKAVEISEQKIAVDGLIMTGGELRQKLGADADVILQLSYLDPGQQKSLLGLSAPPSGTEVPAPPSVAAAPEANPQESDRSGRRGRRSKNDRVRFGGDITIGEGEVVNGDVVAFGGDVKIDGEVAGDVVDFGGEMTLGPHARVHGDTVAIGGSMKRDPAATIDGDVKEIGIGEAIATRWGRRNGDRMFDRFSPFVPVARFGGTVFRVALVILLASIVLLVGRPHVEMIADRAAAEPLKSWAVGFLIEILFVPVLVVTTVLLVISIIGIPLVLLVPVAIVGFFVAALVGFTGVAYHVGRLVEGKIEGVRGRPYLATALGIVVIVSPLLLARLLGFISPIAFFAAIFGACAFVVEYLAWTAGLGAAALVRFGKPLAPTAADLRSPEPPVHPGVA